MHLNCRLAEMGYKYVHALFDQMGNGVRFSLTSTHPKIASAMSMKIEAGEHFSFPKLKSPFAR